MRSAGTLSHLLRAAPAPSATSALDRVSCLHRLHQLAKADLEAAKTDEDRRQAAGLLDLARSGLTMIGMTVASDLGNGGRVSSGLTATPVRPLGQELILGWSVARGSLVAEFEPLHNMQKMSAPDADRYEDIIHRSRFWYSADTRRYGCFEKSAPRNLHKALVAAGFGVVHRGVVPGGLQAEADERTVDRSYSQEVVEGSPAAGR